MTNHCSERNKTRDKLQMKYECNRCAENHGLYKNCENTTKAMLRKAKRAYIKSLLYPFLSASSQWKGISKII